MCGRKIAKHRQMMKFCHFHLTHNIFNYFMRRFFFGLVYISSYVSYVYLDQPHFSLVSDEQQKP